MIVDLCLNAEQLGSLTAAIEDIYTKEGVEHTGLEVTGVQDEGDCFKVFFNYESAGKRFRMNYIYFTATVRPSGVEDFKEVI